MSIHMLNRLFERVRRGEPGALRDLVARETQAWVAHHCKHIHFPVAR